MPIDLWISISILGNAQQFVKSEVCFLLWSVSVLPEILFTSEIKYFQTHEANGLLSNFQSCQQYSTIRRSVGRPVWKNFGCERFPIVLFCVCASALLLFQKKFSASILASKGQNLVAAYPLNVPKRMQPGSRSCHAWKLIPLICFRIRRSIGVEHPSK